MADRYFVMGQVFIADATTTTDRNGRYTTDQTITITGGAGNFSITMAEGMAGTVTSGTAAITGSVVTLVAGLNTLVADGNGTCTLDVTIGSAANWNTTNSWASASGGAAKAAVPTSADNVYFDANSFTTGSQTVTVDAAANCLNMDWTGATNSPDIAVANNIITSGDVTFISAMSTSGAANLLLDGAGKTITSNGLTIGTFAYLPWSTGTLTLGDDFATTSGVRVARGGTFSTGNFDMTCTSFIIPNPVSARTLTLGSSTINCTAFTTDGDVTQLTFNANTSTIKVTGTGAFAGAGLTYNNVELNGTAHTISGSNTFTKLTFKADTTQTITFTDGDTQTATTFVITGSSGKVKTLTGTSTAGWAIAKTGGGYVDCDYMSIDDSRAQPVDTFYAGGNSTNGGDNQGWLWIPYAKRARRGGSAWRILGSNFGV